MSKLSTALAAYQKRRKLTSKGTLASMLFLTRLAKKHGLPLDSSALVTDNKGQVQGLGKSAVQAILRDHGVSRVLAEEGGRTSRGSLGNLLDYVAFLNTLHQAEEADLDAIETWWVDRVRDYFSAQPFMLRYDPGKSIRSIIRDLLAQAFKRQKDNPGTMYAGAVLQHLVGAKLSLVLPRDAVVHHGFSVADAVSARSGDFIIDAVIVHVTTAPGDALMRKCLANIESGARPIIVTTHEGMAGAESLAAIQGIDGKIDLLEAEQFLATNIYEISLFRTTERCVTITRLIDEYNSIVGQCETDPSLRIAVG